MSERIVQESRGNQVVIDLNICICNYTCQLNKHTLQTPLFFHTLQLSTSFFSLNFFSFFFFFFILPSFIFSISQKLTPNNALFEIFLWTITKKNDRRRRYTWIGLNITKSDVCKACKRCQQFQLITLTCKPNSKIVKLFKEWSSTNFLE